jgi:hypothetical protein
MEGRGLNWSDSGQGESVACFEYNSEILVPNLETYLMNICDIV